MTALIFSVLAALNLVLFGAMLVALYVDWALCGEPVSVGRTIQAIATLILGSMCLWLAVIA